jgi:hypothetical protein
MSEPIFERGDGEWIPTAHARGPWDAGSLHGGAPASLMARELEALEPGAEMLLARVTYEFLAPVPLAPLVADAWMTRPGRRMQIIEGALRSAGRPVLRARACRVRRAAIDVPERARGERAPPGDGPQAAAPMPFPEGEAQPGFHRTVMDIRFADGTVYAQGPARAWFRLMRPLVAGEEPSPLQRVVAAADFGNGISSALRFDEHLFVNTDLTVHLTREAIGEWVLLDARTTVDPLGVGLAQAQLYDTAGALGVAAQTLFVDRRPDPSFRPAAPAR